MDNPLISICLPNLNHRRFLEERMETILAQTVKDWELIICDSYSNDGSWDFFQKFKGDPRIRMEQVPREGVYAGWNECLRRARGKYVYIATSDDTASPSLLETLVLPLERRTELKVSICDFLEIDEHGRPLENQTRAANRIFGDSMNTRCLRNGKAEFLLHSCYGTLWRTMTSVLFRRELLTEIGLFRQDQLSFADEEWALRASLASDIAYSPQALATWRVHDSQLTPRNGNSRQDLIVYHSLRSLLADPSSGIPLEWRKINDWDKRLLEPRRDKCLHSLHLYRWIAKTDPKSFFSGVLEAGRYAPSLLINQALHGFSCHEEASLISLAKSLIELFQAKWPPQKVVDW